MLEPFHRCFETACARIISQDYVVFFRRWFLLRWIKDQKLKCCNKSIRYVEKLRMRGRERERIFGFFAIKCNQWKILKQMIFCGCAGVPATEQREYSGMWHYTFHWNRQLCLVASLTCAMHLTFFRVPGRSRKIKCYFAESFLFITRNEVNETDLHSVRNVFIENIFIVLLNRTETIFSWYVCAPSNQIRWCDFRQSIIR